MVTQDKILQLLKVYGSQRKLAEALGVNQSQISRYLTGKTSPRKAVNEKITKKIYYYTKEKFKKYVTETPKFKKFSGKKSIDNRKYVRYEFTLRRYSLIDITKITALMKRLEILYRSVKEKDQQYKTQRLGIAIASNERLKIEKEYFSKKANRNYKKSIEELQFMTTIIHARNKESTIMMFQDLQSKIERYLLGTLESEDIHDTDTTKEAKTFYVFFEDESIQY